MPLAASALGLMEQRSVCCPGHPPAQLGWFWSLRRAQRVCRGLHVSSRVAVTGQGQTDESPTLPAHTGLVGHRNTGVSLQEGLDMGQCVSQLWAFHRTRVSARGAPCPAAADSGEGMKPPALPSPHHLLLLGSGHLRAGQPWMKGQQGVQGEKKREGVSSGRCWGMAEHWVSRRLPQLSTAAPDLASRKLLLFKSKPGATLSPRREAEHGWV